MEVNIVELTSITKTFERRSGTGFRFLYSLLFGKNSANPDSSSDKKSIFLKAVSRTMNLKYDCVDQSLSKGEIE